ncbi:HAMP domain-containing histidine kinase [Candidatus Woesearchaeota archaeon]|nr:HAMP domain-containing histidine kinase [Candidatus Woesearchaeota archaeon]
MFPSLDEVTRNIWAGLEQDPEISVLFTNREPFQWGFRESLYRFIRAGALQGANQTAGRKFSQQEREAIHDLVAHAYLLERRERHFRGRDDQSSNRYPVTGIPFLERVLERIADEVSSSLGLQAYREYTVHRFLERSKDLGDILDDATRTLASHLNMGVSDSSLAEGTLQHPASYFIRAHREIMRFVSERMGLNLYFRALSNSPDEPVEEGNIDTNGRFLVPLASYLECVPPEVTSDANLLQLWKQDLAAQARIFRQNKAIDFYSHGDRSNVSYTAPIITGDLFVVFPSLRDVAAQLDRVVADREERMQAMLDAYTIYLIDKQQGKTGKNFAGYVTRVTVPITDPQGRNLAMAEFTGFPDHPDREIDREFMVFFDSLREEEILRRRKLREEALDILTHEQIVALLRDYQGTRNPREIREYGLQKVYGVLTPEQIGSILHHQDTIAAARTTYEDRVRWQRSPYRTSEGGLFLPDAAGDYAMAYFCETPHAEFIDQVSVIMSLMDNVAGVYHNTKVLRDHLETQRALEAARVDLVTAEAEAAKLLIAAGVAHTAKTPLTTLVANSSMLPQNLRVLLDSDQRAREIGLTDDDFERYRCYRNRSIDYALGEQVRSLDEVRQVASELREVMAGCHSGAARSSSDKYAKMGFTSIELTEYLAHFRRYNLNTLLEIMYTIFDTFSMATDNRRSSVKLNQIMESLATYSFRGTNPEQGVRLDDCVNHALVLTRHLKVENVDLRLDLKKTPPMTCYPGELQEAIVNLIVNSVQALEEKGPLGKESYIHLESYERDGYNCFRITNNGPSIPEENRGNVFEPFFTTKPRGRGSGLGLYICRDIVERRHHGKMAVYSDNKETSFEMRLPRDLR